MSKTNDPLFPHGGQTWVKQPKNQDEGKTDEQLRRERGGDRMRCANCGFKHDGVGTYEHPIEGELDHDD